MQAAKAVARQYRGVSITVFSDRDIAGRREEVDAALSGADAFFGSLLFDYDQVCSLFYLFFIYLFIVQSIYKFIYFIGPHALHRDPPEWSDHNCGPHVAAQHPDVATGSVLRKGRTVRV